VDALKGDAAELKEIAKQKGSLKDKAKAAGDALKTPGQEPPAQSPPGSPEAPTAPPASQRGRG
jgi:hypothetical protein